jgi:DNA-binding transcriptional LysR family regulator
VAAGTLVRLAWREPFQVQTQVVWSDRRTLTPALEAFIETARRTFASSMAAAAGPGVEGPPAGHVPAHSQG